MVSHPRELEKAHRGTALHQTAPLGRRDTHSSLFLIVDYKKYPSLIIYNPSLLPHTHTTPIQTPCIMSNAIRTLSPSTNKVIFEHPGLSLEEARQIAQASQDAFRTYKQTTLAQRKEIVLKALDLIAANKDTLAEELTTQMGRPIAFSAKEIETFRKRGDHILSIAEESLKSLPGTPENGFRRFLKKEPVGPTLIITAWNVSFYPPLIAILNITNDISSPTSSLLTPSSPPSSPETPSSSAHPLRRLSSANVSSPTSPKPVSLPTSSSSSTSAPPTCSTRSSNCPRSSSSHLPALQLADSASAKQSRAELSPSTLNSAEMIPPMSVPTRTSRTWLHSLSTAQSSTRVRVAALWRECTCTQTCMTNLWRRCRRSWLRECLNILLNK